jgi:hypothetical protein
MWMSTSLSTISELHEGSIPSIPNKSMWPEAKPGFFLNPPLLKSTGGGRRKNMMKSALEGGSS